MPGHLTFTATLWASVARGAMLDGPSANAVTVRNLNALEAQLSLGLFQYLELGLALPVGGIEASPVDAAGTGFTAGAPASFSGGGDLRAFVKVPLLRGRDALALRLGASFATGDAAHFLGASSWLATPALAYTRTVNERLRVTGNLGLRLATRNAFGGFEVNDAITASAAASYAFHPRVTASLEANLRVGVGTTAGRDAQVPLELLAGGRFALSRQFAAFAGLGRGLTDSYGTPDLRGFLGLRYERARGNPCAFGPEDYDGFEDGDFCADPDNDGDGVPDASDRCPNDREDRDGFLDDDGCADPDNDGDGVLDDNDRCPLDPEDHDLLQNDDGCPEPDNDRDGIRDVADSCPDEPEDRDGFQDDDGCPEPGPDAVVVTRTDSRLLVNQRIFFDFDSDTIRNVSFPVLDEIANAIRRNPDILRLRIEGYTDDVGTEEYNVDLSFRRARAVLEYLAAHGVEREHLESIGYGQARPVAQDSSPEGQALNRRVEFTILRTASAEAAPEAAPAAPQPSRRRRGGRGR